MSEEIREAVQIIEVAYDGIEIAMKVGSGGIAAMQKAIDFLKGMLDYEKSLGIILFTAFSSSIRYISRAIRRFSICSAHSGFLSASCIYFVCTFSLSASFSCNLTRNFHRNR